MDITNLVCAKDWPYTFTYPTHLNENPQVSNPTHLNENPQVSKPKRERCTVACDPCRKLKSKCDSRKPRCGTCIGKGILCHYRKKEPVTPQFLTKEHLASIEDHLASMGDHLTRIEDRLKPPIQSKPLNAESPVGQEKEPKQISAIIENLPTSTLITPSTIPFADLIWQLFHRTLQQQPHMSEVQIASLIVHIFNPTTIEGTPSELARQYFLCYVHKKATEVFMMLWDEGGQEYLVKMQKDQSLIIDWQRDL